MCFFCIDHIVNVNCSIAVDNWVKEVKLISQDLSSKDLEILSHGDRDDIYTEKTVSFQQAHIGEEGSIWIQAENRLDQCDHCNTAGLLVFCEASNPDSPWHNFHTNKKDWQSPQCGKDLCSNNQARFLASQSEKRKNAQWIDDLLKKGAEHIWVDGNKDVYLLGSPTWPVNGMLYVTPIITKEPKLRIRCEISKLRAKKSALFRVNLMPHKP